MKMTVKFWEKQKPRILKENSNPRKKKARTSDCWKHFEKITITSDGIEKCKCKGCGKEYSCSSKGGTSHLHRHISKCLMLPRFDDVGNLMLDYATKISSRKLDHNVVHELIAQMIILHEIPFQCIEWSSFRTYVDIFLLMKQQQFLEVLLLLM